MSVVMYDKFAYKMFAERRWMKQVKKNVSSVDHPPTPRSPENKNRSVQKSKEPKTVVG